MRKIVLSMTAAVAMLVAFSGEVRAESPVHLSLRLNLWASTWDSNIYYKTSGASYDTSDLGLMVGPTLSLSAGPFAHITPFVNLSYLTSAGDYDFEFRYDDKSASRNDFDVAAGAFLGPYFGLMVGYKSITSEWDDTDNVLHPSWDLSMSGPAFGVLGRIPFGRYVVLTANASYLAMQGSFNDWAGGDVSVPGYTLGAELTYISTIGLNASVGYRYQKFLWDSKRETETFSGMLASISYNFF